MKNALTTIDLSELDQVRGGFAEMIGQFANLIGPLLESNGVRGASQMASQFGNIAQSLIGSFMGMAGNAGAGTPTGAA